MFMDTALHSTDHRYAYDRGTGAAISAARIDGEDIHIVRATYSHRLIGLVGQYPPIGVVRPIVVLDECGNYQWSLPEDAHWVRAVGFDDTLLVQTHPDKGLKHYVVSMEGAVIAGPWASYSGFLSLGSDGTMYFAHLVDGELTVIAMSPALEELAQLHVADNQDRCEGAVLLDDGRLLITCAGGGRINVFTVATASPGLAKTAWPKEGRDNARTGWVAPW